MSKKRSKKQEELLRKIWNKGEIVKGKDPKDYRRDVYGNIIYFKSYGKNTRMGWHKEHGKPRCAGGTDHINNMRPVQAEENFKKGCTYPYKKKVKKEESSSGWGGFAIAGAIVLGIFAAFTGNR